MTEDEIVELYHRLSGHEQTQGDGEGQGSLTYCSLEGCKESDAWRIPWTEEPGRLQSVELQS